MSDSYEFATHRLTAVSDAQHGGFATGWSPVYWGSIDDLFVNLTMPVGGRQRLPPLPPAQTGAARGEDDRKQELGERRHYGDGGRGIEAGEDDELPAHDRQLLSPTHLEGTLVLVADHVWIVEVVLDEVLASVRDELLDDEEAVLVLEVSQVLPFQIGLDRVEKGGAPVSALRQDHGEVDGALPPLAFGPELPVEELVRLLLGRPGELRLGMGVGPLDERAQAGPVHDVGGRHLRENGWGGAREEGRHRDARDTENEEGSRCDHGDRLLSHATEPRKPPSAARRSAEARASPGRCLGAQLAISVNNCPPPRDPRSRMTSFKRTQRKYVQKAYRVRNWREYETGLRARGSLTVGLGLTDGKLANWNSPRPTRRKPGRQRKYSNHAIETTVTLGLVFGLASRQTEGFLRSLLTLLNLDNDVPDHSTISRRKARLGKVASYERRTVKPVHLLIDSSGLSVHVGQLRTPPKARDSRKLHLAVDEQTSDVVACALTSKRARDASRVASLVGQIERPIASAKADAAYDTGDV